MVAEEKPGNRVIRLEARLRDRRLPLLLTAEMTLLAVESWLSSRFNY